MSVPTINLQSPALPTELSADADDTGKHECGWGYDKLIPLVFQSWHTPQSKLVYIWNVDYFDFGADPPLWTFSTIWDIFFCECSPYYNSNSLLLRETHESSTNRRDVRPVLMELTGRTIKRHVYLSQVRARFVCFDHASHVLVLLEWRPLSRLWATSMSSAASLACFMHASARSRIFESFR